MIVQNETLINIGFSVMRLYYHVEYEGY